MFCQKCGAQSAPDAKFCEGCGEPLAAAAPPPAQQPAPQAPPPAFQQAYTPPAQPAAKPGGSNALILGVVGILVLGVVAVTAFLFIFYQNQKNKTEDTKTVVTQPAAQPAPEAPAANTPPQAPPPQAPQGGGFDGSLLDQVNGVTFSNQPLRSSSLPVHTSAALSEAQWRIARNGVYARHGRSFQSAELHEYFYEQRGGVYKLNSAYSDSMLTDADRDNIKYIETLQDGGKARAPAPAASAGSQSLGSMDATLEDCLWTVIEGERLQGSGAGCQSSGALSKANWRILRNAAYARHGRPFKDQSLNKFFYGDGPYAQNADYTDALLTSTDRANIEFIQKMENGAR